MSRSSGAASGEARGLGRRARALGLAALAALGAAGCASAPGSGAGGAPPVLGAFADRRVVVGRFSDVLGVAASQRYVYVAGRDGLAVYDAQFRSWLPPRWREVGERLPTRITALAADPVSDGVWVGGIGEVAFYQPWTDALQRVPVAGVVDVIAFPRGNPGAGALVRAGGAWLQVTPGGSAIPVAAPRPSDVVIPPTLAEIYRRWPALRDLGPNITRDEQLREWPVTSGTVLPGRNEVYLGTRGNGLYRVDPNFLSGEHLPFGLLADGAAAIARAADGVWVASAGDIGVRPRGGLTFARDDLREWRWIEEGWNGPLAGATAFDLAVRGRTAWLATDRGLARLDLRVATPRPELWSAISGLPDDRAFAVLPVEGGAWVGTGRGLAFVSDTGENVRARVERVGPVLAPGVAVRAIVATGDTLWLGTDAGLLLVPPGDSARQAVRTTLVRADPRLGTPVRALAASDSEVVVGLAQGGLVRVNRRDGTLLPRGPADLVSRMGGINAVAMDAQTLWVAGMRGVAVLDRRTNVLRELAAGDELPDVPLDVLLAPGVAWVGTRQGLVRLLRDAEGMPR